jgi:hypothetical protein
MKYQFCIRFINTTVNSAATKAVLDCNKIFFEQGYKDYTLTVPDNANKLKYYIRLLKEMGAFFTALNKGAIVGIQYPLLSVNSVFRYFIRLAKFKGVKFFCIIHDLESLRTGGKNKAAIDKEIKNLNYFDCVIAHNPDMIKWLEANGMNVRSVSLGLFDYLSADTSTKRADTMQKSIAFAGNLSKSTFIYSLDQIVGWNFNVYGPNYTDNKNNGSGNPKWCGEYSPEEIVTKLSGTFGLIWDGDSIDCCDEILGNYLKYNNPHKFSLYIAAGLPIIAPQNSAIGKFIKQHNIGVLINNLADLKTLKIDDDTLRIMKRNVMEIRSKVIKGAYFIQAIISAEELTAA